MSVGAVARVNLFTAVKVLQKVKVLKPNPKPKPRRTGPHAKLTAIWRITLSSLLIDALIVFLKPGYISEPTALNMAILCAVITLPFLDQHRIARTGSKLRAFSKQGEKAQNKAGKLGFFITLAILLASKFILIPSIKNVVGFIFTIIVILAVAKSIVGSIKENRARAEELTNTPTLRISLWERQLVIISLLPIFAARLISLFGALSSEQMQVSVLSISCFAASAILLLCLKPNRSAFIGMCAKCRTPVPIAFVEYGTCPACDKELQAIL